MVNNWYHIVNDLTLRILKEFHSLMATTSILYGSHLSCYYQESSQTYLFLQTSICSLRIHVVVYAHITESISDFYSFVLLDWSWPYMVED